MLKKYDAKLGTVFFNSKLEIISGCYKHGNEPSS
jgi:hypothetical protein